MLQELHENLLRTTRFQWLVVQGVLSLKYEHVYLRDYADLHELERGVARCFAHYNTDRPHQSLGWRPPMEAWSGEARKPAA